MASSHKVLMCIDFGTYGFFASYALPTNLTRSQAIKNWPGMPDTDYGKNLNAILLRKSDPDDIVAYGFNARNRYLAAKEEKEHEDLMYFENFKLQLLQEEEFDTNKEIVAVDGVSTRKLCPLVSQCLSQIVEHCLSFYRTHEAEVELNDVMWIVTVPAIWPLASREAMRLCCQHIGISAESVTIVSEPEAAGSYIVWETEEGQRMGVGDAYTCVDVGSGTFDIVCHELGDERILNELHYADGGRKGAFDVDKAFIGLLSDLVGADVMREFRETVPTEYVKQLQEFQMVRERIRVGDTQKNVELSEELEEMVEERDIDLEERCEEYRISPGDDEEVISIRRGKLIIKQKLWRHLHADVVSGICDRVRDLLAMDDLDGVNRLFVVGGFSKSAYIREGVSDMLSREFGGIELISPPRPELAVARGGLWYAGKQTIATRLLPCTYGICVEREWDGRAGDPVERRVVDADYATYKIENVFHILFEKEDEWETGHFENFEYTVGPGIKRIEIDLYKSDERYPSFVDEVWCLKQATFVYELREADVRAQAQTLMVRCELSEDSIEMFVQLRDVHGMEKNRLPFRMEIGRRDD